MAKISVKPIIGTGVTKITKITLKSIKPTVTFDQTTGVVGAASGDATEIIVANNETDGLTTNTYYAALIPSQTLAAGAFVEITADGQAATYSLAASKAFLAGHQYSLDITVEASALNATNTITDWDDTEAATVASANLTNPLVIAAIDDQDYTGSAIEPNVSVSFNGNTLTSGYTINYVDNIDPGKATAVVSYNGMYGAKEFNILPPSITSPLITGAHVGWVITTEGNVYPNKAVLDVVGATGVAMIAHVGTSGSVDTSEGASEYRGLAIALSDVETTGCWATTGENALTTRSSSFDDMIANMSGILNTSELKAKYPSTSTYAANRATSYSVTGFTPNPSTNGCSNWFLPSMGQWVTFFNNYYANIVSGGTFGWYPSDGNNVAYNAVMNALASAGGESAKLEDNGYWTSTEFNSAHGTYVRFRNTNGIYVHYLGKTNSDIKVRAFFAFK